MKENGECSRLERMASLLFAEKEGEFTKDGVSSSAKNRGGTTVMEKKSSIFHDPIPLWITVWPTIPESAITRSPPQSHFTNYLGLRRRQYNSEPNPQI